MIGRRSALGGIATGLTALSGLGSQANAAVAPGVKLPPPLHGPRINLVQADKIMAQLGLDALVVGGGTSVYHATGLDLTATRMGHAPTVYAIVSRRAQQPISLIAPAFLYYYTIALDHKAEDFPAYVYTAPAGAAADGAEPAAQPFAVFKDRGEAPLDEIERGRAAVVAATLKAQSARADMVYALRKALKDLGLEKGRIAVDVPPVGRDVAAAVPAATIVDADDALRRIRPVKSPMEIALMRYAAQANAEAAIEAAHTVRAGGDVRDLRAAYFAAAAKRGMRGVFMVINRVSSPTYEAKFHDGQCFSIDCVSEYMGYHGDFARSVFVGEPPRSMKGVTKAAAQAWDTIRATLKPGVRFSEIVATGKGALKGLGVDYGISFTPHSVGLYHSDHVGDTGLPTLGDLVLEPGMTISVDCPLLEAGAGGSHHLEDLTLITANGSEQINDIGNRTITV
jgi:Xaa-Pro aminopeptidase